jgi:hypothetical protein
MMRLDEALRLGGAVGSPELLSGHVFVGWLPLG